MSQVPALDMATGRIKVVWGCSRVQLIVNRILYSSCDFLPLHHLVAPCPTHAIIELFFFFLIQLLCCYINVGF
ncbi:hypothetical protein H113_01463 [Trichophyton rubrum MR1459]|uniref:Uncharacterized protein n=1 Tax=Trichophyton rubrum CBS 288.86 TaxID=1215330 RepID=A0A022WDB4_TRIRU|nr:hypothetical protein H100_01453 [Trichophyton rubrum MR850]EZF45418.1 hypothetical protein H102_01448 [Trichophyton rubrum CBS 100081]EZF56078.1 hypothetical protein H103_01460 [Trichophyton rubrum CBS 288.86]EZF66690.1 hypothetical protein H104_01438 [Trichophyton rubrum CBS 289.86]EZF87979.1 hypothetical protein H110_01458 [Trichophyton rubrum MR1448]EZF98914.1 hypothetical protein H113_01463 [Trichophyton rubrum MR1459]EZG20314.1 hypothetical protein H107_01508 [Trichophyton rubrum CBS 